MNLKTIPRSEFDRLVPYNPALESWMVEQVEWFSNSSGTMLGTIARGERSAGWNYVILKRDGKGYLCVRKVMSNFFNLKSARVDLFLSLAEIEKNERAGREGENLGLSPILLELLGLNPDRRPSQPTKASSRSGRMPD